MLALWLLSFGAQAGALEQAREQLLADSRLQDAGLELQVPEWIEDGAFVPVTVRLSGAQVPVELLLLRVGEPDPRIARVVVYVQRETLELSTRVRLPQSQAVEVVARDAGGRSWQASQAVNVAGSSCLVPASSDPLARLGQTQAWRREQGGAVELVSLLRHPMETGRREDHAGKPLPRRLLQSISITVDGQPSVWVEPYEGLSANPYWRLLLPVDAGRVSLRWTDADGQSYHHQLDAPSAR